MFIKLVEVIAFLSSTISGIFQTIKTLRSHSTESFSIPSVITAIITFATWIIYGIYIKSWVIIANDIVLLTCYIVIIVVHFFFDKSR